MQSERPSWETQMEKGASDEEIGKKTLPRGDFHTWGLEHARKRFHCHYHNYQIHISRNPESRNIHHQYSNAWQLQHLHHH
mmetsp:Transcript_2590/g.2961  ORF Transcript_2590/g.2961 Transcript_2590/m.2961 type:complete len:80 (-) Transcript_2590:214-453(-)